MPPLELGEVIATRALELTGAGDPGVEILVQIGKPRPFPDGTDYLCPYQITGIGDAKVRYAAGIDAVQALQLAMSRVGADLLWLNDSYGGRLRWEGDEGGDLGFPRPDE